MCLSVVVVECVCALKEKDIIGAIVVWSRLIVIELQRFLTRPTTSSCLDI